ncbi:MAG: TetR/AcrR family transcriptional regulator [Propionicimonas sp.]
MTSRAERREITQRAILDASSRLLAAGGQEALTVRGLARELNLVPSALYRYVASREELLNILFHHAYNDMADSVEAAHDAVPAEDLRGRWRAFAYALRTWSLEHPHEWVLINGTPPRDYKVPASETMTSGIRLHMLLVRLGADIEASGQMIKLPPIPDTVDVSRLEEFLASTGKTLRVETVVTGVAAWHMLSGILFTERFGFWGNDMIDPADYYDLIVANSERLIFGPI